MREAVRIALTSVLFLLLVTLLAAACAAGSLFLTWAEGHPAVDEALLWGAGTVIMAAVVFACGRVWLAIYNRLGDV